MRKTVTKLLLLLLVAALVCGLAINAGATEFGDAAEAVAYLDAYDEHVGADGDFDTAATRLSPWYGAMCVCMPPSSPCCRRLSPSCWR